MLRNAVALALLFVLLGVTGAREAREASAGNFLLVDNTSDQNLNSGCFDELVDADCSLRGAINLANAIGGLQVIIFNVGSGVPTIVLGAPLPTIIDPVYMDGEGFADAINIYGTNVTNSAGLFLSNHSGSTIKHMMINQFHGGAGLLIRGGGDHTIVGNRIGTNLSGTQAIPNSSGIFLEDTSGNTIGGDQDDPNVISGNTFAGVNLELGANNNTVAGNIIGLSRDSLTTLGNGFGVSIGGSGNVIGSNGSGLTNTIAGNVGNGVSILGGGNTLQNNLIGVNFLDSAKPNGGHGLLVAPFIGEPNVIGGTTQGGNTISGNAGDGVRIESGARVEVSGNSIGINANGVAALPNQGDGVAVVDAAALTAAGITTAIEIGKPGVPNTISGNTGDGVVINGVDGVSVRGNQIGLNAFGITGIPNGLFGINVAAANDTIIESNIITSHAEAGIFIDGRLGDAEGNDIFDNFIGGFPDIVGNGNGIEVTANGNDIEDNTIADNTFDGIIIDGNGNRLAGNFIGTNSDGDDVGNGGNGVTISGNLNTITDGVTFAAQPAGGPGFPIGENIIWNNGGSAVFVAEGTGNTINRTSMKDNFAGAIDLAPEGPTPNDTDDPDSGANDKQNFPVLTLAGQLVSPQGGHPSGGGGILQGSLNSTPNSDFIIDVYTQPQCNETANLQPAEEWIGAFEVTTNANGDAQFSRTGFTDMEPGDFINATATNSTGSTSELSACIQATITFVTPAPSPTPDPTGTPGPTGTPTPTPSPTDVKGDADCDGDVDTDDFSAALSEVAGVPPGAPCSDNVGCEDPIDAEDALEVLKFVASPDDFPFPPC